MDFLGYGSVDGLTPNQHESLKSEIEAALDNRDEAKVSAEGGRIRPKTALQKMFLKYLALQEELSFRVAGIDIDD